MSTAALSVLGSAIAVTRDDNSRIEAINLASREIEITRDTFGSITRGPDQVPTNRIENPNQLPGGVDGEPLVVNNVPYTVVRTAQWISIDDAAASSCDQGATTELASLRVKVEVSWPSLGDRPPVTVDTVLTPPKGTYSKLAGHIGVKVINAEGGPLGGRVVTATGPSGIRSEVTGSDGCVLLAFLDAGTYAVTVSSPDYVNRRGDPTATTTAQVQAGRLWRGSIEYDQAATITARLTYAEGYPPASDTVPVVLGNSGISPGGSVAIDGIGETRTLGHLWPYPSGYQLWAGRCLDNDPQFTGEGRDEPVPALPGGTEALVWLAAVKVTSAPGVAVTARHVKVSAAEAGTPPDVDPDPGCPAWHIPLGTTDQDGVLRTSLPYGNWDLGTDGGADLMLRKGDPPTVVELPCRPPSVAAAPASPAPTGTPTRG
jgi:hypothetical protein